MKLLFATSLLPENEASSGYEIANRALVHGLMALNHEVVCIGFANPGQSNFVAPGSINLGELSITNSGADMRQKLSWLARAIQNKTTFAGAKLQIIAQDVFASVIERSGPFDAIIINGAPMAAAFEEILTRSAFVYVAHNVEWQTAAENAKNSEGFFERTLFAREARMLKALEQRMVSKAKHVFTLANEDIKPFAQMGARWVSSVPMIVGLDAVSPVKRAPKWDAGLIGTWSWAPNKVGLDWFLNEVSIFLPDDFTFAIAGNLPGNPVIKHPGATVLGRVPSAHDFTRDCACLPLVSRAGSGIQLKTLEAFELGLPSVATTASVRGIAKIPENCVIQDDPELFARELVTMARRKAPADLDGRKFHGTQKTQMLAALKSGLTVFNAHGVLQAAE